MRSFLIVIITLFTSIAHAQDSKYLAVSATPGFLLAHRADIKNLASHNVGVEIAYEKDVQNSTWGKHYTKPTVGYSLLYYNFGKEETGHAIGGLSHVKLNIAQIGKSDLKFRMGAGLAYLTQKFDVYENRRNQAIGSHLNGSMQFGLVGHTPFGKSKHYVDYGISITHYSNAAFKVPNLGYNIPSFILRYGYNLGNNTSRVDHDTAANNTKKINWVALLIYGKKQRNFANPVNFYNVGLQLRGLKRVSSVKAWRFGLDYTLDKTYKYSEDPFYPLDQVTLAQMSEVAIAGGYQWSFGKACVIAELGAYLYKPAVLKNALSQRMGVGYNFTDHLTAQGTLRFHRGVADFFEIGIGYTL